MASVFDFKKEYSDLYRQKQTPQIIDVPKATYFAIDGKGDPNTSPAYQNAIEGLYGLSYTVKMRKNESTQPDGYFDFVVPPLEGLWWFEDYTNITTIDKSTFLWTSMIRHPSFVTPSVIEETLAKLAAKKPDLDLANFRQLTLTEGLCAQVMHLGSYDNEPETIDNLISFVEGEGYSIDLNSTRKHHEIYLSDFRKTAPEKLKTIIRYPIK